MPSTTVNRSVTLQEAADALREQLGSQYTVTPHQDASRETISVKRGLGFANVHLIRDGGSTTFRVHGRGVFIGLLVNELGIARTVRTAIRDAIGSSPTN